LLQETLPFLRRQGYALSALQPFSVDYYRRFGYVLTATTTRHFFPVARLSREGEIEPVRPVRSENIPALRRLYETVAAGKPLRCQRDTKRWEYILWHARQSLVYAPNRRAQGYLLYDYLPARIQRLSSHSTALPTIRILEWNAPTVGARAAFTAYLAAQPNVGGILLEVPADCDSAALTLTDSSSDVSTVREPLLMARLLNFPEAIAARLAQQSYAGGELLLQYQETSSQEASAVRISASPKGTAQVDRAQPSEAGAYSERVEASGDAWTQLITGYLGIEEFLKARGVQVQGRFAAGWLPDLFSPLPAPFLPIPDRF
jgi:predicted acetyltransferase